MSECLKIAVIGDFNFTYNSHHATNMALEHSERYLEVELSYYWIRPSEAVNMRPHTFSVYDGILIAPGPYFNEFFLSGVLGQVINLNTPLLMTGEVYRLFIELLIKQNNLNGNNEKLISDNLVSGNQFEPVQIQPLNSSMKKLYATHSNVELTSSRYSLYPRLLDALQDQVLSIEGRDQFEEPEIVRLKNHTFALATMFCPQISSTREMPHPLINLFVRACLEQLKTAGETV